MFNFISRKKTLELGMREFLELLPNSTQNLIVKNLTNVFEGTYGRKVDEISLYGSAEIEVKFK